MLQLKNICKTYKTGDLIQGALKDVSLNFRDSEFVAILGPSGSGKTTLLNIIGGLDHYDSGELIINNISTKKYKDKDWDSYRNHTIGFVFQSYNLIPHQSIISNVELALTISGISKAERIRRSKEALEKVGLSKHINKKPNQLSGGQMQRVAIARALVNNPEILLADEPTGALDSETSIQVMELLKEVAKDRLVIMVTHNPELANQYATRIVSLHDGEIKSDTNEVKIEADGSIAEHRNMGKAHMSFLTALSLSFNNLWTKKARTVLTSFAGSIGIIGIAAILSLSTGVNEYIKNIESDTLAGYPLELESSGLNITSMMLGVGKSMMEEGEGIGVTQMVTSMFSSLDSNDLGSFKSYIDEGKSGIEDYITAIEYEYSITPNIFRLTNDSEKYRQVNPDQSFAAMGISQSVATSSALPISNVASMGVAFNQLPQNENLYKPQYEIKAGHWPTNKNEAVVVLMGNGNITDFTLYALGLRDSSELEKMVKAFVAKETVEEISDLGRLKYDDILGITFNVVNTSEYYTYNDEYNLWVDNTSNKTYMTDLISNSEQLKIVGIAQPLDSDNISQLNSGIYYTYDLTKYLIESAANSDIVQEQLKDKYLDVFTGKDFDAEDKESNLTFEDLFTVDNEKIENSFKTDDLDFGDKFNFELPEINLDNIDISKITSSENQIPLDLNIDTESLMAGMLGNIDNIGNISSVETPGQNSYSNLTNFTEEDLDTLATLINLKYTTYFNNELLSNFIDTLDIKELMINNIIVSKEGLVKIISDLSEYYKEYIQIPTNKNITFQEYLEETLTQELIQESTQTLIELDEESVKAEVIKSLAEYINNDSQDSLKQIISESIEELMISKMMKGNTGMNTSVPGPLPGMITIPENPGGEYILPVEPKPPVEVESILKSDSITSSDPPDINEMLQSQIQDAVSTMIEENMTKMFGELIDNIQSEIQSQLGSLEETMQDQLNFEDMFSFDTNTFAEAIQFNMSEEELLSLMTSFMGKTESSYTNNLKTLGYTDLNSPDSISIYPIDFESKLKVIDIIDEYNDRMKETDDTKVVKYTDIVGSLMSSVTDIIDAISYVLVAFVTISLIVSSIMIGIITYISVLERQKEIGILRSIGASKKNISQVFNAETFIVGLFAGLIGIGSTLLLLIPGNKLIHTIMDSNDITARLPLGAALILIMLSVVLTLIGGIIPSKKAANSDPVIALRSE